MSMTSRVSRRVAPLWLGTILLFASPAPARADLTAFVGVTPDPSTRPLYGVAAGAGLLIIGFEFEYMSVTEDLARGAPSLWSGMGHLYVQNPIPIGGLQFYGIAGAGLFREQLGTLSTLNVGTNLGGGVKIALAGPLRLRLDYRVFALAGSPLYSTPQRFYAGLNLKF
jgi:hypothetical protein